MDKGFFASLFDTSFSHFITPKLIRVIFILEMALFGLAAIGFTLYAFGDGGFFAGIFAAAVGALGFTIATMFARISLELAIVMFRSVDFSRETAANTSVIARAAQRSPVA